MDKPCNITDYLRHICENAWSSWRLEVEFEWFVKRYFRVEPYYASQFTEVWLWNECPFAKGNDVGVDIVVRTNFSEYEAIRAKCYKLVTQVYKADADQQIPVSRIGLAQIQASAIDRDKFLAGAKKTIVKKTLMPHQTAAVKDVIVGFKKHERGQLIMTCCTGKTYTLPKIAKAVCAGGTGESGKSGKPGKTS